MVDNAISEQLNVPISEAEIKSNTLKLVNGKSSGLDSILNEHIKSTLHLMLPIYLKLFNIVLDTGIVPRAWTEGCIIPIFKNKGCKENPANYRPITLLSCMGKLFTAIINSRLQIFSTEFNIIQQNQSGFRKNYSTMDNVFVLQALFDILASKKKKMYCAFIDFQRAFDTVWRAGLWKKLIDSNIKGKCFNVIYSMYQGIKSCVSVNGELSTFFQCSTGVRQGENISPFLFSIYLNDLEDHLRFDHINGIKLVLHTDEVFLFLKIFVLLYADDTALLAESREDLQTALDSFEQYCRMWKLTVNIEKTKIIVFGRGKIKTDLAFHLNNQNIEIVKHFKYLGVIFSRGGSFQASIKHNCEQAAKAMFLLIRKMKTLDLSVDTQIELFDKMIKPILLYGSEIWGYSNVKPIERIHVKFLKSIFNLKQSTPNVMLYGEFGVYPIEIDIKVRLISFWSKVAETDSLKYSNMIYQHLFYSNVPSKWMIFCKNILRNTGYSGIWDNQSVDNPKWLVESVKQRLKDVYISDWHRNINESSSCLNYRLLKDTFKFESYLTKLPFNMRKTLILFRTRNHRLPVEIGRWHNIDINDRKCTCCNTVGDEFHYLLCCDLFSQDRAHYIKAYFSTNPNIIKFKQLMNTSNISELKKLSKFISIILKSIDRPTNV